MTSEHQGARAPRSTSLTLMRLRFSPLAKAFPLEWRGTLASVGVPPGLSGRPGDAPTASDGEPPPASPQGALPPQAVPTTERNSYPSNLPSSAYFGVRRREDKPR